MNAQDTRGVLADPTVRAFAPLGAALVGTPLVLGIVIAACGRLAGASLSWASLAGAAGALACAAWLARSIVVARARARHTSASEPRVVLRLRSEAHAQLTVLGGRLPAVAMADRVGSALVSVTLHANAENHLLIFTTTAAGRGLTSAPLEVSLIHDDQPPAIDLVTPKDVDRLQLSVLASTGVLYQEEVPLGPAGTRLPTVFRIDRGLHALAIETLQPPA